MSQTKQAINQQPGRLHMCLTVTVSMAAAESAFCFVQAGRAGWDWLLDTLAVEINRKMMRDPATLSPRPPSVWALPHSHPSPLFPSIKER